MSKLLADVIEAHGGLDRWRSVSLGEATIVTGGDLWGLKGLIPPLSGHAASDGCISSSRRESSWCGLRESEGRPKTPPRKAGGSGKHHGLCCPPRYRLADTNRSVLHIEQGTRSRRYRWPRSRPSSSSASWTCLRCAIPTSRWMQSSQYASPRCLTR